MRGVKNAIDTFLESKIVHLETMETGEERPGNSKASSLFSFSSYSSSIFSFSTGCESETSDSIIPNRIEICESGSCPGTSSPLTLALLPPTNMGSIQIPPSLLGSNYLNEEQYWSELTPHFPTDSPAPYQTYKERYLNIFPYLWLHGRLWHGDRVSYGTLLVSRYSTQSGKIELSKVLIRSAKGYPLFSRRSQESLRADAIIFLEDAMLQLSIPDNPTHLGHRSNRSPFSFYRMPAMPDDQLSLHDSTAIWPPMVFDATSRTTRSSFFRRSLEERPQYSLNLFAVKKTALGVDRPELFSALDPQVYTPDIEHPLRGIWCWRNTTADQFMLFHQQRRNHLAGLKLTGDGGMERGEKVFEFEAIQDGLQEENFLLGSILYCGPSLENPVFEKSLTVTAKTSKCSLEWVNSDYLIIQLHDYYDEKYHFRRVDVKQFF